MLNKDLNIKGLGLLSAVYVSHKVNYVGHPTDVYFIPYIVRFDSGMLRYVAVICFHCIHVKQFFLTCILLTVLFQVFLSEGTFFMAMPF